MSEPFVLGVNYWSRKTAMFFWRNFDAETVREEFATIASIGMTVVRIFLLWEDWQPTPDTVSETALDNLQTVMDIADENGLKLDVTFFTGHMSGPNWSPDWLLDKKVEFPAGGTPRQVINNGKPVDSNYRNMFHDKQALDASRLLLKTVVTRFKDHPAVYLWNLGNEPDLFAWPHSHTAGAEWVAEMVGIIKEIDPDHLVTCGLHIDSLVRDNGLWVNEVFASCDIAVMHGYPMYASWATDPLDPHFVPFISALTGALSGKPVLMEEWGGCTAPPGEPSQVWNWTAYGEPRQQFMSAETDLADYIAQVQNNLIAVGAIGSMLWCYADYIEELWDKPPCKESRHERFFGVVRPNGSLKPHADVVKQFASTNPTVQPAIRTVELDITPEEYYADPLTHIKRLYKIFHDTYAAS